MRRAGRRRPPRYSPSLPEDADLASARRRCSGSAGATGAASWSRPTTARRWSGRPGTPSRAWPRLQLCAGSRDVVSTSIRSSRAPRPSTVMRQSSGERGSDPAAPATSAPSSKTADGTSRSGPRRGHPVRRPRPQEHGLSGQRVRAAAARRRRADGADHAGGYGGRAGRHPARDAAPRPRLPVGHRLRADRTRQPRPSRWRSEGQSAIAEGGMPESAPGLDGCRAPLYVRVSGRDAEVRRSRSRPPGSRRHNSGTEIDHLDGVLILDHPAKRLLLLKGRARESLRGGQPPVEDQAGDEGRAP